MAVSARKRRLPAPPLSAETVPREEREGKPQARFRRTKPPAYRQKLANGHAYAYLTLSDAVTKRRKDIPLGAWGSDVSRRRYAAMIAQWEARGRRLPEDSTRTAGLGGPLVSQIASTYQEWAETRLDRRDVEHLRGLIRILGESHPDTAAGDFGPVALRRARDAMLAADWSRGYIAAQVRRLRAMFRWAASHELVPISIYDALRTVEPLRKGQGRESGKVGPADPKSVAAVRAAVSRQLRAIIDLQLLTGMRPGEACSMRPGDIDRRGKVWIYRPAQHKGKHRGRRREIYLAAKAQAVIRPFLKGRAADAPLFSPTEAEANRRTVWDWERRPGSAYNPHAYSSAVRKACKALGVPHWHPHQLRHTYATRVRRLHDVEAAAILLGHSSAQITDAVYAERDRKRAIAVARKMG